MRTLPIGSVWLVILSTVTFGQDRFPTPVLPLEVSVQIEPFAVVPDSNPGQPPRLSVMTPDLSGRWFVNDQRGPLYTIDATGSQVTEYLDLRDFPDLALTSSSEAGFQSFAWHPESARAGAEGFGRFYTIHSSSNISPVPDFDPGGGSRLHTVLLEWRTADPSAPIFQPAESSRPYREILRFSQPFGNHNAGLIAFNSTTNADDADYGNLYVALGDGGSGGDPQENGQDPSNPYGALLRIDPLGRDGTNGQYGIVADNLLAIDGDDETLGEIYSYGLRNPQRFGWDTATGQLYIADIGQNAVEEINLGANGANFGWDDREGSFRFESSNTEGLTDPVAEYDHTNVVVNPPTNIPNRAVTVGEVARGTGIPGMDGLLLLSDFPTGLLFTLDVDRDPLDGGQDGLRELQPQDANGQPVRLLSLINQVRDDRGLSPVSRVDLRFGLNTPGEVYILNKHDGVIRRLTGLPETGDFNGDGQLGIEDVVLLSDAIATGSEDPSFDLSGDQSVDLDDLTIWVVTRKQTWFGDADLDGQFDSSDFVEVFQLGQYEDAIEKNSNWATGDWNADLDFDSADFVVAFQDGGYEQGLRGMLRTVPEPANLVLALMGVLSFLALRGRFRR